MVSVVHSGWEKTKAAFKRKCDTRLRESLPSNINSGHQSLVGKECYNPEREKRPKLLPIAEDPSPVVFVAPDTIVLDIHSYQELLSRYRIVFARPNCHGHRWGSLRTKVHLRFRLRHSLRPFLPSNHAAAFLNS